MKKITIVNRAIKRNDKSIFELEQAGLDADDLRKANINLKYRRVSLRPPKGVDRMERA